MTALAPAVFRLHSERLRGSKPTRGDLYDALDAIGAAIAQDATRLGQLEWQLAQCEAKRCAAEKIAAAYRGERTPVSSAPELSRHEAGLPERGEP